MKIPFEYGEVVSKSQFVNREQERDRLKTNLTGGINTMLISPRRWGKSSLVKQVELDVKDTQYIFCYLDLFRIKDESEFYSQLAKVVLNKSSSKLEELLSHIKSFIKKLIPKITLGTDPVNDFEISFDFNELEKNYEEILNLPEQLARKKQLRFIICIDEFQNLERFNDPLLFQQRLRSVWQHHKYVSYCLYGSKKHITQNLFENKSMPFYKFGDLMYLQKIDTNHWVKYIVRQFKKTGRTIEAELANKIAHTVQNHSYYVQQLAHLVWVRTESSATPQAVDNAINDLLKQGSMYYSRELDNLTNPQINFLNAIINQEKNLHAAKVIRQYNLGTSSNVSRIKTALEKKEIIELVGSKVELNDPVFGLWLFRFFEG